MRRDPQPLPSAGARCQTARGARRLWQRSAEAVTATEPGPHTQLAFVQHIDGQRTIRQIAARVASSCPAARRDRDRDPRRRNRPHTFSERYGNSISLPSPSTPPNRLEQAALQADRPSDARAARSRKRLFPDAPMSFLAGYENQSVSAGRTRFGESWSACPGCDAGRSELRHGNGGRGTGAHGQRQQPDRLGGR